MTGGFEHPNYTQVPNDLFDRIMPDLKPGELLCLLYIIRHTFGFNRRGGESISLDEFQHGKRLRGGTRGDRGTGLQEASVLQSLSGLEERQLIHRIRETDGSGAFQATRYRLRFHTGTAAPEAPETRDPSPDFHGDPSPDFHGEPLPPISMGSPSHANQGKLPLRERNMEKESSSKKTRARAHACEATPPAAAAAPPPVAALASPAPTPTEPAVSAEAFDLLDAIYHDPPLSRQLAAGCTPEFVRASIDLVRSRAPANFAGMLRTALRERWAEREPAPAIPNRSRKETWEESYARVEKSLEGKPHRTLEEVIFGPNAFGPTEESHVANIPPGHQPDAPRLRGHPG